LELTVEGRQCTANLYCNVFVVEHGRRRMGPHTERQSAVSVRGGIAANARPKRLRARE